MKTVATERAQEIGEFDPPTKLEPLNGIPDVIWLLAWFTFIASLVLILFGLMGSAAYLAIIGAIGIITTPFMLAIADIIKSLRQIVINTAKDRP